MSSSPSPTCIAIVTGANRLNGIGLACVRGLAAEYPHSSFNRGGPLLIYLTSRSQESGEAALAAVTRQIQETSAAAAVEVKLRLLDLESEASISSFAASMAADHPEGIDILVNNAGVVGLTDPEEGMKLPAVEWTVRCNYYGTLGLTQALLPQVRRGGRIVNVSSLAGVLTLGSHHLYPEATERRFLEAETVEDITSIMKDFVAAVKEGTWQGKWPGNA